MPQATLVARGMALVLSTLVSLGLAEVIVRAVSPQPLPSQEALREWIAPGMYVADERAGYRGTPNFTGVVRRYDVVTEFTTNSLGLRGPEPDPTRRPRVLALGDSNTWGWGVAQGSEWAAQLEEALAERHARVQVLNGGTSGYGTVHALGLLERLGPELTPELVLLGFYPNDYADNLVGTEAYAVRDGYLFDLRAEAYWRDRPLARFSHLHRLANRVADDLGVKWLGGVPSQRVGRGFDQGDMVRAGVLSASLIERMRDRAAASGARFAVVWLPSSEYVVSRGRNPIRERLQGDVERAGIPSVDLLGPLRRVDDLHRHYIAGDGHFDVRGHRLIAREVARFIADHGLLEGPVSE